MTTAICPGCVRPVTASPVICPQCNAAYHAACRDTLGCVVPGCAPRRKVIADLHAWTPAWIGARVTGLFSVLAAITVWVQEYRHNTSWLPGGLFVGLNLFTLFVWVGCLQDGASGRVAGRRRGTMGLLWITTTVGIMWAISLVMWRPRNMLTFPCGAGYLIGTLYGFAGLMNDDRVGRALLAVLTGAPLFLLMLAM